MSTNETETVESPVEGHVGEDTNLTTLEEGLESNDYDGEQIQAAIEAEKARPQNDDGPRAGAMDLLKEAFNETTGGPNIPDGDSENEADLSDLTGGGDTAPATVSGMDVDADAVDENGDIAVGRVGQGHGATEAGTPGIILPSPYDEDAPERITIDVPEKMGVTNVGFVDSPGEYEVPYSMPLKLSLETESNPLAIAASDPLHPSNRDADGEE